MKSQPYKIVFKKSALKDLESLPVHVKKKCAEAIQHLSINPYTELLSIKKLKGADDLYRIRVNDYRIVYTIHKETVVIRIIRVGHRREVYT